MKYTLIVTDGRGGLVCIYRQADLLTSIKVTRGAAMVGNLVEVIENL